MEQKYFSHFSFRHQSRQDYKAIWSPISCNNLTEISLAKGSIKYRIIPKPHSSWDEWSRWSESHLPIEFEAQRIQGAPKARSPIWLVRKDKLHAQSVNFISILSLSSNFLFRPVTQRNGLPPDPAFLHPPLKVSMLHYVHNVSAGWWYYLHGEWSQCLLKATCST